MKKYFAMFLFTIAMLCPMQAFAKTGNMKIQLPENGAEAVSCAKVGNMVNGIFVLEDGYEESQVDLNGLKTARELEDAAELLMKYEKSGNVYQLDEEGTVLIQDMEEGVYLIHGFGKTSKDISPGLVFLPTWMEEEKELLYDITVVPKYREPAPDTGNDDLGGIYGMIVLASFLTVLFFSRRKCDIM